jgi:hypothetical protein
MLQQKFVVQIATQNRNQKSYLSRLKVSSSALEHERSTPAGGYFLISTQLRGITWLSLKLNAGFVQSGRVRRQSIEVAGLVLGSCNIC